MRNVRSIVSAGLVTLGALLIAAPAIAQEGTLKKIKDTNTITLGHRDASIPFSYFDDKQQPVGYAMDLCGKIVEAVKAELKMPTLQVKLNPVTSATRIPLMANGTVDLECGSTTNNLERQKQVAFTITHFVTANRFVSKKASNLKSLDDLRRRAVRGALRHHAPQGRSLVQEGRRRRDDQDLQVGRELPEDAPVPVVFHWLSSALRPSGRGAHE